MVFEQTALILISITTAVNVVFATGFFGLPTIKSVSDEHKTRFTPHRLTFLIWSVIYGFLIAMCIHGVFFSPVYIDRIGVLFIAWCVLNMVWVLAFSLERIYFSMYVNILILLVSFLMYHNIGVGYFESINWVAENNDSVKFWLYMIPMSITLGWIIIAVVANFFARGTIEKRAEIQDIALVLFILQIVAFFALLITGDIFMVLVFCWAILGILYEQSNSATVGSTSEEYDQVSTIESPPSSQDPSTPKPSPTKLPKLEGPLILALAGFGLWVMVYFVFINKNSRIF